MRALRPPRRLPSPTPPAEGHRAPADHRDKPRIIGVDAARGLALLGMFAVHVFTPFDSDASPSVAWMVAGGRSAATFAVLAGVGLAFTAGGRHPPPGRTAKAAIAVRALLIGLAGLLLGYVSNAADLDVGVILPYYALLFLLALPLLRLRPRTLACAALGIAAVAPIIVHAAAGRLLAPRFDGDPTLTHVFTDPIAVAVDLLVVGDYPAAAWSAYICVGLAIGRLDPGSVRVAVRLFGGGLTLAAGAWFASSLWLFRLGGLRQLWQAGYPGTHWHDAHDTVLWDTPDRPTWWSLISRAPHSTTPFDMLDTLGAATALLGALLLLTRATAAARVLAPLAAAGSMPLTLYCAQVLFLATGVLSDSAHARYAAVVAGALLFAVVWRRTRGRGPLEAALSRSTKQVRRRTAAQSG